VSGIPRPPYDPELVASLGTIPSADSGSADLVAHWRRVLVDRDVVSLLGGRDIEYEDHVVPGRPGQPDVTVALFRRPDHGGSRPAIYHTHGGGMFAGDRVDVPTEHLDWIERHDIVVASVEYRLAPENPDPAPVEDCYAGLVWVAAHARELGLDPARLVVSGSSAGGGLAAGTALLARDRSGPPIAGQLLACPMLDDRDATVSTRQFPGTGPWHRDDNVAGWTALLGDRRGGPHVSPYAAPSRATDLSALPRTYIDVGSAEVFRDEAVAYASAIWASGGDAELHVWPGAHHGFEYAAPGIAISGAAQGSREAWVKRVLRL
jgi:acetyl esterase/lipase